MHSVGPDPAAEEAATAQAESRLAYSVKETAVLLSIGTDAVYELLHTRKLASAKIGRRRIISRSELERFLEAETQLGMAS